MQKSRHPRSSKVHLNEKHLPKPYWAKAENSVVYLMKRCTTSGVHEITPHEKYYGKKPNLSHIRIFVGYSLEQKWYKCLNLSTWKVRVSWDVVIDESASWHAPESTPLEPSTNDLDNTEDDNQLRSIPDESPIWTRLMNHKCLQATEALLGQVQRWTKETKKC